MKRIPGLMICLVLLLMAVSPMQRAMATDSVTVPAAPSTAEFVPYQRLVMLLVDPNRTTNGQSTSRYGDLYSWAPGETTLHRETHHRYNDRPIMSPDGTHVVYLSLPDQFVYALERGEAQLPEDSFGGPPPTNIWLMDLTKPLNALNRFMRITDQVTGLPTDSDGSIMQMQRRSQPVWSPDSTQIAWLELDYLTTAFSGRVMVYDTRTSTTHIAAREVSLGYADGGYWEVPDLVGWGDVIAHISQDAQDYNLAVLNANSRLYTLPVRDFNNFDDALSESRWLLHGNKWRLGLYYPNLGWVVLDTSQRTFELLKSPPFIGAVTITGWTGHLISTEPPTIEWRNNGGSASDVDQEGLLTFSPEGIPLWIGPDWRIRTLNQIGGIVVSLPVENALQVASIVWTPSIWMTDGHAAAIQPLISR